MAVDDQERAAFRRKLVEAVELAHMSALMEGQGAAPNRRNPYVPGTPVGEVYDAVYKLALQVGKKLGARPATAENSEHGAPLDRIGALEAYYTVLNDQMDKLATELKDLAKARTRRTAKA